MSPQTATPNDQRIYETLRQVYLNTENMAVRHIMEDAMVYLLRRGVQPPCPRM